MALSAYEKACRKINDSYQAEIKKSAWMSAAMGALGPVTAAGVMVTLGVTGGALVPVTGPAILAVVAAYSVVGGIWKFAQKRGEAVKQRDSGLRHAGDLDDPLTVALSNGWSAAHSMAIEGTLSKEDLARTYWMTDKDGRTVGQMAKWHESMSKDFRAAMKRAAMKPTKSVDVAIDTTTQELKQGSQEMEENIRKGASTSEADKGQMFKLATDAGKLAWNSSHAMSMGTTEERETHRGSQAAMGSMSNDPEARLARMVQTVMEADMRGMFTDSVVTEMREEGQRLGLVDTDVDAVLGIAGDAYAYMAASRAQSPAFNDGIYERLNQRVSLVVAGLQGHDSVEEAEESFTQNYANYSVAYGNNREAVERLTNGEHEILSYEAPLRHTNTEQRDGRVIRQNVDTDIPVDQDKAQDIQCVTDSLSAMRDACKSAAENPDVGTISRFSAKKMEGALSDSIKDAAFLRSPENGGNPKSVFRTMGERLETVLSNTGEAIMAAGGMACEQLTHHVNQLTNAVHKLGGDVSQQVKPFKDRVEAESSQHRTDNTLRQGPAD